MNPRVAGVAALITSLTSCLLLEEQPCSDAGCFPYLCQTYGGCDDECYSASQCADGYRCTDSGQCVPGCVACGAYACDDFYRECEDSCYSSTQCAPGYECDLGSGRCE
jgi:hypothetical protein